MEYGSVAPRRADVDSHPRGLPRCRDVSTVALPPFWSLVEAHGDELLVHARRMAGDANGEDVLQDALLRALRAYPRLRHADHLRAWLYRVTTTTALDHHRARRREVLTDEPPAVVDRARALRRHVRVADRRAARRRRRPRCGCASSRTSTTSGIATRLGCSAVAARQRVSTAIRTLRTQGIPA